MIDSSPCRQRALAVVVLLSIGAGCSDNAPPDARTPVRLTPTSATSTSTDLAPLFDRDTTTALHVSRPMDVVVEFPQAVELRSVKAYAGRQLVLSTESLGEERVDGDEGWRTFAASRGKSTRSLRVHLAPTGPDSHLSELELWGVSAAAAPRVPQALGEASRPGQPFEFANVLRVEASPPSLELAPRGAAGGASCGTVRLGAPTIALRGARRAFLAYEAQGIARSVALQRSVNGRVPSGGFWLEASDTARTLVDELDPEELTDANEFVLCLPTEATRTVRLAGLRLVLELDDGTNLLDRDAQARLGAAYDGDRHTATLLSAGELVLPLGRPAELQSSGLELDSPRAHLEARSQNGAEWIERGEVDLEKGWNALPLEGARVSAVSVRFAGVARVDVPAASVGEVTLSGSGVGKRVATPRIVVTYPALHGTVKGDSGEHFGGRGFVAGWAESPAGSGRVEVDGMPAGAVAGAFGALAERPAGREGPWQVTLRATFPDGAVVTRVIHFDDDRADELRAEAVVDAATGGDDERFGKEGQTAWDLVHPDRGGNVRLGSEVEFDAPGGALDRAISVGITRKAPEVVPPLDAGMVNVTAPANAAYRFSPAGQKFKKAVKVRLPYDERLLPEGMSPELVRTYFFDPVQRRWVVLARLGVERERRRVVSETDHFTFMINAVLVTPEHPGVTSFNPTSIKDLKTADPAAGIDFIEPPQGNSQGTARTGFPIRLPKARGAFQPSVTLTYDSGATTGWAGLGWDVPTSSVAVETRFGVPGYAGDELYVLDGRQLVPLASTGGAKCLSGGEGGVRRYAERVASGFQRILRCGADTKTFHWEVTDTQGTVFIYGHNAGARLQDPKRLHIAEWMLERAVDTNGNAALLTYAMDAKGMAPADGPFASRSGEDWRRLYLSTIEYSAHVSSPFAAPKLGAAYRVSFVQDGTADGPVERPDVVTSGRTGFKVASRFRLGAIRVELLVGEDKGVIREYVLTYESEHVRFGEGFGRSLLKSIQVKGAGAPGSPNAGPEFYTHTLEYYRSEVGDRSFTSPKRWAFEGGASKDALALSDSKEFTSREATYVGLAPPMLPIKSLSSGGVVGNHHGEAEHARAVRGHQRRRATGPRGRSERDVQPGDADRGCEWPPNAQADLCAYGPLGRPGRRGARRAERGGARGPRARGHLRRRLRLGDALRHRPGQHRRNELTLGRAAGPHRRGR